MSGILRMTIGQLLQELAEKQPTNEAVVYHDRNLRYTYQQFNEICDQAAKSFMALGIQKEEKVAIWATNTPEWLITQFATAKMGATLVTVNTNYQANELEFLLRQSDSTTLILIESFKTHYFMETLYKVIPELRNAEPGKLQSKKLPFLKNIIILGEKYYPGTYTWNQVLEKSVEVGDIELKERMDSLHYDDVINMQYTSGTTGFPKGVMLTHSNLVNNGRKIAECMKLTNKDRMCIPVPFFHCFGCVLGTLAAVSVGATIVPVQEFNAAKVLETVQNEKCTALHGVPTMFINELNLDNYNDYNLSSLRTGIMAGSNCPIEVMRAVVERMGIKEITIAYGQTESSPVITQTRTDDPIELRVSSVGRVHSDVEVKIIEPETGKEVAYGVQGELCTRGYHVMKGYYKNEQATREVIDENGWLHTGDLAVMDENGYVKITGRLKDMIIRGGENIYPREIEEFLYRHPQVLDVQVVGVPDPKYGEEVMAWVIPKEGENPTAEEIRSFCKGQISFHKIPRYIEFTKSFPMTASGKIQKFKLQKQSEQFIMKKPLFTKILIANRGEIASRIIRTCKRLNIATVAVYSEADSEAPFVRQADEAYLLGNPQPMNSYNNIEKIMAIAKQTNSSAIHPGYGFLSENPLLAVRCQEEGIVFIGPKADVIEKMGKKIEARKAMEVAGLPVVPGISFPLKNVEDAAIEAQKIGYPIMLKASAGGGGIGMGVIRDENELRKAYEGHQKRAQTFFNNGDMFIEKLVLNPRHIEIQVLVDTHGNGVYLGERECSIQRRNQKVIEEAPSPFVSAAKREEMGKAAVKAALVIGYENAGTFEFMMDEEQNYYFLEMNTRLQVEHPITEEVTGFDLVEQQIKIAAGEKLDFTQADVQLQGHAIEARIYAEDPQTFYPSPGKIVALTLPEGPSIRHDIGVEVNSAVSPFYDGMFAKLIVKGENREQCIANLEEALAGYQVGGIKTNLSMIKQVIQHEQFRKGNTTTSFVEKYYLNREGSNV